MVNAFGRYDLIMFLLEQENNKESYSIIIKKRVGVILQKGSI